MVKESKTARHIPQLFLRLFSLILLSGGSMKVRGTGKQERQRENGLKVSCIVILRNVAIVLQLFLSSEYFFFLKFGITLATLKFCVNAPFYRQKLKPLFITGKK